jgi:hypothetical protein
MHENRETSELSAKGSGADRPEKANCRTTGMNGAEESDCAIVLVNQSNKRCLLTQRQSAEIGEGRAQNVWTPIAYNSPVFPRLPSAPALTPIGD